MAETLEDINSIIWLIVALVSLVPLVIFLKGYFRTRSRRLLLTSIAFLLFFIEAVILSLKLFIPTWDSSPWYLDDEFWWSIAALMDIAIICLITVSLTMKS